VISRALEDSFGQLQLDGDGRRIPRPPAAAHGDVDEGDDDEEDRKDEEDGAGAMATGAGGAPSVTGVLPRQNLMMCMRSTLAH
jgi:hypothetical protein